MCDLTSPFRILSVNSSWWNLNGLTFPLEAEYKGKPLQEVLQRSNHFSMNIVDSLFALLPRVASGIPNRVPFISVRNGQKVFFYLRVVPLVNENLEVSSALLTLAEAPLPLHVATSIQEHTIISDPIKATTTLPSQSGWDMLRKTPFVHLSPEFDLPFHGSSSMIDPVWGGTLPFPHSQVLDAPLRSQLSQSTTSSESHENA